MTDALRLRPLASHVFLALARAQSRGRAVRLDELARDIGARKSDVREIVSRLHHEGALDALRLRLTLSGLALAASLRGCKLPPLRAARRAATAAA
jgi:hypothetical protein